MKRVHGAATMLSERSTVRRLTVLAVASVLLAGAILASIAVGSSTIPLDQVWALLRAPDRSIESHTVNELRMTRTIIGVLVGVALAVAGAVMQAVTRNPLADPGLLGVNSGASLAIVLGAALGGLTSPSAQFALSALGAMAATALVYAIGSGAGIAAGFGWRGRRGGRRAKHGGMGGGVGGGATPVRLVLAGVALSAASTGIVGAILLLDPEVFDAFRFWDVGALTRMDMPLWIVSAAVLTGVAIVVAVARPLSDIALGDDVAAALGTDVARTRAIALVALTLLCAAATAVAGPISFVGLMVPLICAWLMGPHRGWIIAACAVTGPVLVLGADLVGRIIARPAEMQVGLLTAFVGAPVLLHMLGRLREGRR
ncbi:FecCD family ABC transporter permease [Corynebacterium sp. NPDC060344]|uniref:FecCD family ABC transporter permease n=1 Tax=Corynebacterium sp. NPDC060344 TaxID=3347101 RepID=UPI003658874F